MTDQCPHAKSDMTPCVLKDGPVCFAMVIDYQCACVGCGRTPEQLGVDKPGDWDKQIADYYRDKRRTR